MKPYYLNLYITITIINSVYVNLKRLRFVIIIREVFIFLHTFLVLRGGNILCIINSSQSRVL